MRPLPACCRHGGRGLRKVTGLMGSLGGWTVTSAMGIGRRLNTFSRCCYIHFPGKPEIFPSLKGSLTGGCRVEEGTGGTEDGLADPKPSTKTGMIVMSIYCLCYSQHFIFISGETPAGQKNIITEMCLCFFTHKCLIYFTMCGTEPTTFPEATHTHTSVCIMGCVAAGFT